MKRLLFRKQQRLKTNQQFRNVLDKRNCLRDKYMALFVAENDCGFPRLGISVPRAVGNAVVRNRLKRYARESFRTQQHQIQQNFDYLVMINKKPGRNSNNKNLCAAKKISPADIRESFIKLAKQAAEKQLRNSTP